MFIHPNARAVISKLAIPSPIKKYFSDDLWEIDLSNNTNPYLELFSEYPDVKQDDLKNLYLSRIQDSNSSADLKNAQNSNLTSENLLFTVGCIMTTITTA